MRFKVAILCAALAATASTGCKKKGTGGGGGGWLVGSEGMMAQVDPNGRLGAGYDLGASETLNGIACRYQAEAWVVGAGGTLLYTADGGVSWSAQDVGTTANLRTLATQDAGPVFIAGDGVFMTAVPEFVTGKAQWTQLGDGVTSYRSVAAAQHADTVLAVSSDGGLWSYDAGVLSRRTTLAGMHAVAVSPDGETAIAVGAGLSRSLDGGKTWSPLAVDASLQFEDVRIDDNGEAVAVGVGGIVARIDGEGRVLTQRVGTADLRTLHIAPADDYSGVGYAAGDGGQIWMTNDSGWTWTAGPNVGHTVLGVDEIGAGHR
ncbi:MAG: hypothetical protein H6Q90_1745 [Deltaproteobacteria bacterium]|nr:hypothetical protein [Deltaproteobacteria bacterium]